VGRAARARAPRRRPGQGFGGSVYREPGAIALDAGSHDGETDTIAGDRGTVCDPDAVIATGYLQAPQVVGPGMDSNPLADIGDDAGEHFRFFRRFRWRPHRRS